MQSVSNEFLGLYKKFVSSFILPIRDLTLIDSMENISILSKSLYWSLVTYGQLWLFNIDTSSSSISLFNRLNRLKLDSPCSWSKVIPLGRIGSVPT